MCLHQSLLLGEMLINSDETGRDSLMKTLQKLCTEIEYFAEELPEDDTFNDVYKRLNEDELIK